MPNPLKITGKDVLLDTNVLIYQLNGTIDISDELVKAKSLSISSITEAELFVLNRQGQLIYHASNKDIPVETPVLTWDGKSNGRYVPTGNYVVVIILRNSAYSLEEKKTGTLLILS